MLGLFTIQLDVILREQVRTRSQRDVVIFDYRVIIELHDDWRIFGVIRVFEHRFGKDT